jgi:hypothetical protein
VGNGGGTVVSGGEGGVATGALATGGVAGGGVLGVGAGGGAVGAFAIGGVAVDEEVLEPLGLLEPLQPATASAHAAAAAKSVRSTTFMSSSVGDSLSGHLPCHRGCPSLGGLPVPCQPGRGVPPEAVARHPRHLAA